MLFHSRGLRTGRCGFDRSVSGSRPWACHLSRTVGRGGAAPESRARRTACLPSSRTCIAPRRAGRPREPLRVGCSESLTRAVALARPWDSRRPALRRRPLCLGSDRKLRPVASPSAASCARVRESERSAASGCRRSRDPPPARQSQPTLHPAPDDAANPTAAPTCHTAPTPL